MRDGTIRSVEISERALDPRRTRRARHPLDGDVAAQEFGGHAGSLFLQVDFKVKTCVQGERFKRPSG